MRWLALGFLTLSLAGPATASDNAVAYRLYAEGRYAEAAEIFTDPAWKGVAMYRSDQYWRAAEAFVRADDPVSIYNLGNCYAKLGYYELALQAYLNAASRDPSLRDAVANAAIMRQMLAQRDEGQGLAPQSRKIDEVEAEPQDKGATADQGQERGKAQEQRNSEDRERSRASSDTQGQTQTAEGRSGDGAERQREGEAGRTEIAGTQGEPDRSGNPSGGSEAEGTPPADQAAGQRMKLETGQATEQWLNRIRDEPEKFLKARIALEARRRAASGNLPPAGGDTW